MEHVGLEIVKKWAISYYFQASMHDALVYVKAPTTDKATMPKLMADVVPQQLTKFIIY